MKYTSVDLDKLEMQKPFNLSRGGVFVFFKNPVVYQTPFRMDCPFGRHDFEDNKRYTVELKFPSAWDQEGTPENDFYKFVDACDEHLLKVAEANYTEYFKQPVKDRDEVKMRLKINHVRCIKENASGDYPPMMKVKIPEKNGQFTTKVYDHEAKLQPIEYADKACSMYGILNFKGMWVVNGKFGPLLEMHQMKVYKNSTSILSDEYSFKDDTEVESFNQKHIADGSDRGVGALKRKFEEGPVEGGGLDVAADAKKVAAC